MISELTDDEILDFLMTSDFEADYKPEELKYLLFKWRYFYRLLHGKHEVRKGDQEMELRKYQEELTLRDNKILTLQSENAKRQDLIDSMKNRTLTFKERWSGKIITNENENK
jgi:hypothetical protein